MCTSTATGRPLDPAACELTAALAEFKACALPACEAVAGVESFTVGAWRACSANCTDVSASSPPQQTRCAVLHDQWEVC
jgi:hypothetical protein